MLKLYYKRTSLYYKRAKIQPAPGDGGSSTKVVLPENENPAGRRRRRFQYERCTTRERKSSRPPETAVPVLKLYYKRTKIQPAAGDGGSSTKVVLPENENPAGRRRRRFQYERCATRERKSSRPPETVVPVLKLYYQRTKIQPAAGDGGSSTKVVLPENENRAGRRRLRFQYERCTTRERKSSRPPETAVPVLELYYKRTKIQPAAGDGGSSTKVVLPENENPAGRRRRRFQYERCTTREQPAAGDGGSSMKGVLQENEFVLQESENPAGRRRRRFQY